ncbi:uncharacterized protein CcaverHIS019_0107280 [Cutaneotrichosporon cavernicola]|uniref:MHYT domain-containing protein n=1 Tax=Cutaneotrichosporon cavernicola TaxID=279322 RepID=A0AA48L0B7_9TREE|nr:uncharacterized protein CcaverHIS019_0107280 [Cutaneotrichosporon cavernicola]BEI88010.1 hypothetical protein CcaverHIS019_0107280 [Cutaneotrichosporon cavernicola]BEI95785.1 hypothetical protein CcaverHIS631_0107340 [Cutaneotrichosporon cavernicola]BEJ03558.1 hypothetical protein CcaverHIS641_0107330 [Cutaneotrichosporon cavernicola]
MRAATVAFVFALTAPYLAEASPVPFPSRSSHDPHPPTTKERDSTLAEAAIVGTISLLQSALRGTSDDPRAPPDRRWPQLGAAWFDPAQQLYRLPEGYVVLRQTMSPGFIVLSYLMSLVGALCTLELLIRRTSNRGISNVLLLASAGICFGAVSTFAMHFVGNQSLALHHPKQLEDPSYPDIHLSYQGGYTVLSLVASCLAMTFAFFVMGTDIRVSQWKQWWYSSGSSTAGSDRKLRRTPTSPSWKLHKAKASVRSANVATIFHQAGMMPSWSLDGPRGRHSNGGWKDLMPWRSARRPSNPLAPQTYDTDVDEDTLIRQDKELNELDFRHGRLAVRDELDRRALHVGTLQDSDAGSPVSPVSPLLSQQTQLQLSPLAPFYPAGPQATPTYRAPSPTFDPGYSFPPRDSTTNLLPHHEPVPPPLASLAPMAGREPAVMQSGRRASLPAITTPFTPRIAQTLSRIQSLPEPDPDAPTTPNILQDAQLPHADLAEPPSNTQSKVTCSATTSSSDAATGTTGDEFDSDALYDEEGELKIKKVGWRERLRFKIQAGLPLTRLEQAQRFLGLDVVTWTEVFKIFVTGMVAGWGVAAMHYIGQVSINDIPYIGYKVGYVVGSVIIASSAVIIALYIMFIMLRPKLKHSWLSKIMVAFILALAVCGMHYTGMRGTIYGWEMDRRPNAATSMSGTKRAITGIVAALAFVACLGVATFIVMNSIRDRKERARRHRVVVASVLLDDQDRMCVSAIDGMLPMCDIASLSPGDDGTKKRALNETASSIESSGLGVDLTTHNEAFLQAMKMSWSWRNPFWSSLNPFASASEIVGTNGLELAPSPLPVAAAQLPTPPSTPLQLQHRGSIATDATASQSVISGISVVTKLNIARFLEKFAVSATQLSVRLTGKQEGLSRLGVLYDKILTTGWVRLRNGKDTVSKGQLIFLVRRVTSDEERSDLLSRHFIFADASSVATSLHKTLSTPFDGVLSLLDDMRTFCDHTMRMSLRPNTLYAGVAVVQATPFDGLRILLNSEDRSQIPMREVCTFSTLPGLPVDVADGLAGTLQEIGQAVTWLDGMSLLSVITRNMSPENVPPRVARLLAALEKAIVPILDNLLSQEDMAYILPRLTLHPVLVPLTPASAGRTGSPGWAAPHIIVFYANYDVTVTSFADQWHPFSLFRAQNSCVMAGAIDRISRAAASVPEHNIYARRPSKVQFEEPAFGNYSFARDEWSPLAASRERQPPRRSSLSKTPARETESNDISGIAEWEPNWLINLLRARLRADA